MAEGSYIGLRRDSKNVVEETNKWITETLKGVPEDQQADALERMLTVRELHKERTINRSR